MERWVRWEGGKEKNASFTEVSPSLFFLFFTAAVLLVESKEGGKKKELSNNQFPVVAKMCNHFNFFPPSLFILFFLLAQLDKLCNAITFSSRRKEKKLSSDFLCSIMMCNYAVGREKKVWHDFLLLYRLLLQGPEKAGCQMLLAFSVWYLTNQRRDVNTQIIFYYPTNFDTTRATPTATPLVVISDGIEIWVALVALRVFFPPF